MALHDPGNIPSGYIKVFEDIETDRAFFININMNGFEKSYDYVYIKGQAKRCKVVEQGTNYMLVKVNQLDRVYGGLSGSIVKSDNYEDIGFISELYKDGVIKVIANK